MKTVKWIIAGIIFFIAIFYVLPASLLQIPYFQEKVSHQITNYLKKKLQSEVYLRKIEYGFFNKLVLKDLMLEDQSGELLFTAKRVAVNYDFFQLIQKKWRFNSVQLITFQMHLNRETDHSPLNIQFIIDAFANPDTTATDPTIDLRIKSLRMHAGSFSYRVNDQAETPGLFNHKQLLLSDISSKIQIQILNNREMVLQFNKLRFKEQSGLQINNLTFDLTANEIEAKIDQLTIEFNQSFFTFSDISAIYQLPTAEENDKEPFAFQFQLNTSTFYPKELSAIVPAFSNFDDRISIEGDFLGKENEFLIRNFYFRYYNQIMISADANLRNIFNSNGNPFYIRGNISNSFFSPDGIERLVNNLSRQPIELPQMIKQMKNIRFEGDVQGTYNDLAARGVLNTDIGIIQTNLTLGEDETLFLKGQIASESLNIEKLLNNTDYGEMSFDIQLDAKHNQDKKFSGSVDASLPQFVYKGYTYQNISLNGDFTPTSFNGNLNLNSPEGRITGKGLWVFNGVNSKFDFQAKATDIQLDKLNLSKKYHQSLLSFELDADLTGDNPDDFEGVISVNNLLFTSNKGIYHSKEFKISSIPLENEKFLTISSDIISGEIRGDYSYKSLIPALKQTFANYLPSLIKPDPKFSGDGETDISIYLSIEDMTNISHVFHLPFSFHGKTEVSGKYDGDRLQLNLTAPHAVLSSMKMDSLRIEFANSDQKAQVDISGISLQKRNAKVDFNLQLSAANDKLNTELLWGKNFEEFKGELQLTSFFSKNNERAPIRMETNIRQTEMIINDSIWTLNPATVIVDLPNIQIDQFHLFHKDQFLKINGILSNNPAEELRLDLNRMDLDYIFQTLNIPALEFGGMATGFAKAQDVFHTRKVEAQMNIIDFSFNSVNFGHLHNLTGSWDEENQGVVLLGKVEKNDSTYVNVNGIIYPLKEEISINFDAKHADARFLRKYVHKVVEDLTGNLSGRLRLFGKWDYPTIEGDVFAQNCRFGIKYLNTFYTFSDSVKCLPDSIKANNIVIYDERGNRALTNGFVKHRFFQDFYYSGTVAYNNFMVYNATKPLNSLFYGTAFGNGTASIYGTEDIINIDATIQNTENTKITFNFMEEADVEDFDFIRFVSVRNSEAEPAKKQHPVSEPAASGGNIGSEIRLNLILDANRDAAIDMIMDPVSGDKLSGFGRGNLQVQYGTKIPLKVLGNYEIEYGKYNFTLQQFFVRLFDIQEGSTVTFRGNPYVADLNINAKYTVNANLEDLDRRLIENKRSARSNVPVNCILKLTGPLNLPSIAFDIDLPGANDELVRQVKSYIRTDDMMNRQIVYLLVLSRFYTPPENMRDNYANSNWSYLTSTLSSQLSSILGSLSDNVRVGTVFYQSTNSAQQTATEFELLLSSHLLNNRLIINGNFGYSNNPYTGNQNGFPLIGDFDLEYKLSKSGDIRLKGFNRYNYRNYYSITPEMTQGIGILFRKDFNNWLKLFDRTGKKEEEEEEEENASETEE